MMNETVKHGCVQKAMPDFEKLIKLTDDDSKGKIREPEFTKIREIQSRQDKRDPQRTKQSVRGPISRRRSRRIRHGDTLGSPSFFTWRY